MGQAEVVGDLEGCGDAATCAVLQAQIGISAGAGATDVKFRNSETAGTDPGIEADGSRIDVGVAAFLKLAETIPAKAQAIYSIGRKDMGFADGEIVDRRGSDAEPRIQLGASLRTGAAAWKFVFAGGIDETG